MNRTDAVALAFFIAGCALIAWLRWRPSTTKTEPTPHQPTKYRGYIE